AITSRFNPCDFVASTLPNYLTEARPAAPARNLALRSPAADVNQIIRNAFSVLKIQRGFFFGVDGIHRFNYESSKANCIAQVNPLLVTRVVIRESKKSVVLQFLATAFKNRAQAFAKILTGE